MRSVIAPGPAAAPGPAMAPGPAPAPAYDPEYARVNTDSRFMDDIHEMAVSGKSIIAAMGTRMPMPGWDDILILGAQLNPPPLDEHAPVLSLIHISATPSCGPASQGKPFPATGWPSPLATACPRCAAAGSWWWWATA